MTYDLWTEASYDHEGMAHQAALDGADAELREMFPFLAAARSAAELDHRIAFAMGRLQAIASAHGLPVHELDEMARRRWVLYREALNEGLDPLQQVVQDSQGGGYGAGPEKPDEHDEGPDFSHGYSEVPQGAPGGPSPQVTVPRVLQPGQVQEATGARHTACASCGCGSNPKGKCKGCKKKQCACGPSSPCGGMQAHARRTAAAGDDYLSETPPDMGVGAGATDMGVAANSPSLQGAPEASLPISPPSIGQVTSSRDPVHRQVEAVAASVQASNPRLPAAEARRIARQVVGRYLLTADLGSEVTSDDPGGGGTTVNVNGGGTGVAGHMLEWQGAKSLVKGMGGGAAAGGAEDAVALAAL